MLLFFSDLLVGGSFVVNRTEVSSSPLPIFLSVTGFSTSWNIHTVFHVSGVTGCRITATIFISPTFVFLYLIPSDGAAVGTITLSNNSDSATTRITVTPAVNKNVSQFRYNTLVQSLIRVSENNRENQQNNEDLLWQKAQQIKPSF